MTFLLQCVICLLCISFCSFLQCGGCWAFSVVEAIESVSTKDGGKLQELSVQQVIDCSYENYGCNGGSPAEALDWLMQVLSSAFSISHDDVTGKIAFYSTTIHFNCFNQWCRPRGPVSCRVQLQARPI